MQRKQAFDHGCVLLVDHPPGAFRCDGEGVLERRLCMFVTLERHITKAHALKEVGHIHRTDQFVDLMPVRAVASVLAVSGVAAGDRVAVVLAHHIDHAVTVFALAKLGAVQVPVNTHLKGAGLEHVLSHSAPKLIVADGVFAAVLEPILTAALELQAVWRGGCPDWSMDSRVFETLAAHSDVEEPSYVAGDSDQRAILYTSGTTGPAKGVQMTDRMYRAEVWTEFQERFGVPVREGYGMTETSSFSVINVDGKLGSIGKAVDYFDVEIVDESGRRLERGQIGEIRVSEREPGTLTIGYFRNEEKTAETIREGWLYTGDLGREDEDGYFFFLGRKKDSLRRRGENVSAWEVENVVNSHPDVEECALIGVVNEFSDEDLTIFLKLKGESVAFDYAQFVAWCEKRMARFQVPRFVALVESFPKQVTKRSPRYPVKLPSPPRSSVSPRCVADARACIPRHVRRRVPRSRRSGRCARGADRLARSACRRA